MSTDDLRVSRTLVVPAAELEWRFSTSGGPGGQHANRAATKVEVRFDVVASAVLGPRQRARLRERLGDVVVVTSSESRSQARNREAAAERLKEKLAGALREAPRRRATRPSAAARRRRVTSKRRRGDVKRLRRPPEASD